MKTEKLITIVFYSLVISLPLLWLDILSIGSFRLKYVQLFSLVIIPLLFVNRGLVVHGRQFIFDNKNIIGVFLMLLGANFFSDIANNTVGDADWGGYLFRNGNYIIYFVLYGALLSYKSVNKNNFYRDILYSNFLMITVFIAIAMVVFFSQGKVFIIELLNAFFRGDSDFIRYSIYRSLFNMGGEFTGDDSYAVHLVNVIMGSFIYVVFTSLYIKPYLKIKINRLLCNFNVVAGIIFIVTAISRSNIVALCLGFGIYFLLRHLSGKSIRLNAKILLTFLIIVLFGLVVYSYNYESINNAFSLLSERFMQIEDDGRLKLNAQTMDMIAQRPFLGYGSNAKLDDSHAVHNFILGSFLQVGIIGLLLSCSFYLLLLKKVFNTRIFFLKNQFWVVSIMMLPLFRTMISGSSGSLTPVEWYCVAFFLVRYWEIKKETLQLKYK